MHLLWPMARMLGDLLAAPVLWLPPVVGLLVLSAGLGLLLLLAFRWLTPQRALGRAREGMSAALYEMRLFASSPSRVLAAQGRALWLTLRYLALAFPSLLVLAPLLALVLTRASLPMEHRALRAGEQAVVALELRQPVAPARLQVASDGDGLLVLPPALRLDGGRRLFLRLRARSAGRHRLRLTVAGQQVTKEVLVDTAGPLSRVLASASSPSLLLGREPPLPAGPLQRVEIDYPRRRLTWLGLPWWLHLLLGSMLVALLLRRRLGVVL